MPNLKFTTTQKTYFLPHCFFEQNKTLHLQVYLAILTT
jgi:hypothetical protein